MSEYPDAVDPGKVGSYPAVAGAGGGYVWDDVLEYRVWCHPERGAKVHQNGDDYYYAFAIYSDAVDCFQHTSGAEEPLALILQREYIDEPESGEFRHVKEPRVAEWSVQFLKRQKRTSSTLTDFFAPDAPANKLDIIRGLVK
jgi:hypothetical protein